MVSEARKVIDAMIIAAFSKMPYDMSAAFSALSFKETDKVPTMGVDKYWRLYYNPAWTLANRNEYGLMLHEVRHLLYAHHERSVTIGVTRERVPAWQVAIDLEINDVIVAAGLPLPADGCYAEKFDLPVGLSAEEYLIHLLESAENKSGSGGEGEEHGSGSTPFPGEWEEGAPEKPMTRADVEAIRDTVAREMLAAEAAKPGTLAAHEQVWAGARVRPPTISWQDHLRSTLRGAVAVAGRDERTWRRSSRRDHGDVLMPGRQSIIPAITVLVDTSGSMNGFGEAAISEVDGVLRASRAAIDVVSGDTEIGARRRVTSLAGVSFVGGGGTDMDGIIVALAAERQRIDLMIVVTDGDTGWPAKPPPFPVIIVLVAGDRPTPQWAKTLVAGKEVPL